MTQYVLGVGGGGEIETTSLFVLNHSCYNVYLHGTGDISRITTVTSVFV